MTVALSCWGLETVGGGGSSKLSWRENFFCFLLLPSSEVATKECSATQSAKSSNVAKEEREVSDDIDRSEGWADSTEFPDL